MSYAIVGFGKIGQALAHAFARKNINVTVASRRSPEELALRALEIGPTVVAKTLQDALQADTIIFAVPFGQHREMAKALPSWKGKTIIDAMNSFPTPPEELDGLHFLRLRGEVVYRRQVGEGLQPPGCGQIGYRPDRRGWAPRRLSFERRRRRIRSRRGSGKRTRVCSRQAGKAQRGRRIGEQHADRVLGSTYLPRSVQEGAVINRSRELFPRRSNSSNT